MPDPRPTRVRHVIVLLTTLIAVLLYVDRNCLGFLGPYIAEDAGLSTAQLSLFFSSFYWAYALAQVPAGWLSDSFGARIVLTLLLIGWSLCTGFIGLVYGLVPLILLSLCCGLFQSGAYPTAAGLIRNWIPFRRRGFASGLVSIGGRIGGAIMPPLTALLLVAFVPVSTPSTLTPPDVSFDKRPRLMKVLHEPQANLMEKDKKPGPEDEARLAVVRRFITRLPAETRAYINNFATFGKPNDLTDEAFAENVLKGLNEALARANLFQTREGSEEKTLPLEDLRLPAEAKRLLGDSSANTDEIQRRNRLVLESALPGLVRRVYGAAWRRVVLVYSAAGILLAVIFFWYFRNRPAQHSAVNTAEIALIEPKNTEAHAGPTSRPPLPWREILTNRSLWLISMVQFLTNLGWSFLVSLFPAYLLLQHKVSVDEAGWMAGVPFMIGIGGTFVGGWLTDWTTRKLGVRLGRLLPLALSRFLVAGAFFACLVLSTPWPITLAMAVVAIGTDLGVAATWAFCLDVGGKNTAAVLGWGNMWGNIGSAVSPVLLQAIADRWDFNAMFAACGFVFVLAGVLSLGVDATSRVAPEGD